MKKVKKIPNCCSYNSPGFTYSQPFQTDAQIVFDLILSYEHPPKGRLFDVFSFLCVLEKLAELRLREGDEAGADLGYPARLAGGVLRLGGVFLEA